MPSFPTMDAPSTIPPLRKKETGDRKQVPARPLLPPCWGRRHFKPLLTRIRSAKTCLTRCRAGDNALSPVDVASAAAARDSGPRGPTRDATPDGTPHCRNAGRHLRPAPRTPHSSLADHTAACNNLRSPALGADPRTRPPRQLTSPHAHAAVGGKHGSVPVAAHGRGRWPGNAGSPGPGASAVPPPHKHHCNTGSADAAAQTIVHNPSAGNDAPDVVDAPLVPAARRDEMSPDPREPLSLMVKSRGQASTWPRGVSPCST